MGRIRLRLRLTLIYGLLLGATILAAAFLTHTLLNQNLLRELDDTLSLRSSTLHRALNVTDEGFDIGRLTASSLQIPVNEFAASGIYVQVLDQRGLVVAASANLQDQSLPIDPSVIADGLAAKPTLVTLPAGQGEHLRVLTMPMIHGQHVVGLLQVATSLHTVNAALRVLGYQLGFGAAGIWLLTLLLIWWVLGRALQPVSAISSIAGHIADTGDVGKRIAYKGPADELGELAATFNHMLERIQSTLAAHRQFVADSSHQLGTPLTVIRGNAELLGQVLDPANREECVFAIKTEVERMDKIIGDLLTLAQLDARPALAKELVRLDALAEEVVGQVRGVAGDRRITVETAEAIRVNGDRHQLAELLLNLLHNAIRYSRDGTSITVRVDACVAPESTDVAPQTDAISLARLVVADQGVGIAGAELDRIFDRFYRVNQAQVQGGRSAGLGLAIVKAIVEAHGGRVTVESAEGEGSRFTVVFPVGRGPDERGKRADRRP